MQSKQALLQHLENNTQVLRDAVVKRAFEQVDRKDFVPHELRHEAYEDYPLPIGHGQTISQPTTVAFMLKLLGAEQGMKVLDVGCGSGWTTALLAAIVGEAGKVYGLEIVPDLVEFGSDNLAQYDFPHAEIQKATKNTLGLPEKRPYDRILVSAAAHRDVPEELVGQLKADGKMVIPVGDSIFEITKNDDGTVEKKSHYGFAFVPLIQDN